jgi:hypothetical protein
MRTTDAELDAIEAPSASVAGGADVRLSRVALHGGRDPRHGGDQRLRSRIDKPELCHGVLRQGRVGEAVRVGHTGGRDSHQAHGHARRDLPRERDRAAGVLGIEVAGSRREKAAFGQSCDRRAGAAAGRLERQQQRIGHQRRGIDHRRIGDGGVADRGDVRRGRIGSVGDAQSDDLVVPEARDVREGFDGRQVATVLLRLAGGRGLIEHLRELDGNGVHVVVGQRVHREPRAGGGDGPPRALHGVVRHGRGRLDCRGSVRGEVDHLQLTVEEVHGQSACGTVRRADEPHGLHRIELSGGGLVPVGRRRHHAVFDARQQHRIAVADHRGEQQQR